MSLFVRSLEFHFTSTNAADRSQRAVTPPFPRTESLALELWHSRCESVFSTLTRFPALRKTVEHRTVVATFEAANTDLQYAQRRRDSLADLCVPFTSSSFQFYFHSSRFVHFRVFAPILSTKKKMESNFPYS